MSILGNRVQRVEDQRFLTGQGRFLPNIVPAGAAHVVFVRSTMAHARLLEVDLGEATTMPGVLAVVDAETLGAKPVPNPFGETPTYLERYPLAQEVVRHVGEAIVAVVAETEAQAIDAAEVVFVDYEPLDAVIGARDAVGSATLVYDELGSNVLPPLPLPEMAALDFSECEIVIEAEIDNSRMNAAPIEARVAAAEWHDDDTLTCWSSTQGAHPARSQLAGVAGLDPEQVRVIVPDIGGGFGAKALPGVEEGALGLLSRRVGRPVVWYETRTENLQSMCHGRAQYHTAKLGGTREGRITHYSLHNLLDAGHVPTGMGFLPILTSTVVQGCYDIEHVHYGFDGVVTNTSTVGAFRGAGRPEAIATLERMVDMYAAEIGIDPLAVRALNLITDDAFPYTSKTGSVYDAGNYAEGLRLACELAGYAELRAEQAARRERGERVQLGIGVVSYVEITAGAPGPQREFGSITLDDDGGFTVRSGATAMGQGTDTTIAMLAAERMGVSIDRIRVVSGDTEAVASSGLTAGSRTTQVLGPTIVDAAQQLVEAATPVAATALEAAAADVVFDTVEGRFSVIGTPSISVGWSDVASASEQPLVTIGDAVQESPTFPSGANVAVVAVDTETGEVELLRLIAADDAGTIINDLLAEGQVHGGLGAGIAQALFEEIVYDEDGNLVTSNFMDYAVPSAAEFPSFETVSYSTPSPNNSLGAKGIGESGTIGSTPAIQNAVIDAIRHLGVRHLDMPMTPQKIWQALR